MLVHGERSEPSAGHRETRFLSLDSPLESSLKRALDVALEFAKTTYTLQDGFLQGRTGV